MNRASSSAQHWPWDQMINASSSIMPIPITRIGLATGS
jgi:hypothetical protein